MLQQIGMSPIQKYLARYVALRRMIALIAAIFWAGIIALVCVMLIARLHHRMEIQIAGTVLGLTVLARPVFFLFRKFSPVAAAMEIESKKPVFDQRLITLASVPDNSPMVGQLKAEVEAIVVQRSARVMPSLRPLTFPIFGVIAVVAFEAITRWLL